MTAIIREVYAHEYMGMMEKPEHQVMLKVHHRHVVWTAEYQVGFTLTEAEVQQAQEGKV